MGKYIYYEESPYNKGKYTLCLNHNEFPLEGGTSGSYNVLLAKIAGLSYADFLRMCRDEFGAELVGKNSKYIVPYFSFGEGLFAITKFLDARAKYLIYRYKHPYDFILNEEGEVIGKQMDSGEIEKI